MSGVPDENDLRRIGHDLLNLLAAIGNYAGTIGRRASDEPTRTDAEALRRVTDRATDLVREMMGRPPAERAAPVASPGRGERVLVVEDEPGIRDLVVQVLSGAGYTVLEAGGADEALAVIDKGGPVDLLVTDWHLPGMSGEQLVARAAERSPDVHVLFASGEPRRGGARGVWLQKPFTAEALLAKVREALDASAAGS